VTRTAQRSDRVPESQGADAGSGAGTGSLRAAEAYVLKVADDAGAGRLVLVTGATGYIGGRLVPLLLEAGFTVRVLARQPGRLRDRPWVARVEVVRGDGSDPRAVADALRDVEVAYYLLHSLTGGSSFAVEDAAMARTFAAAASAAGVSRIVFLGGLVPPGVPVKRLSEHLRSRREVGEILRSSRVPTIELCAAVIIGSGSASFEMLRYLTERLPAMTTPRWVNSRIQPIAVRDVLRYLVAAADLPPELNRTFDVGGPDVLTYADMMRRYSAVAGLRPRLIIPVPVLTPGLSSHWVGLVTPVPASIARPLVESLRHEVVCHEHDIATFIPDPPDGLTGFDEAVRKALTHVREATVDTRWSEASYPGTSAEPWPGDPDWAGGTLYRDVREHLVHATPHQLWTVLDAIGGEHGWYSFPLAWWARGAIDRAVGGVGLRRGRRNPTRLAVGDVLDFWRVEERIPDQLLRLRAEMRLPGLAWLEFSLQAAGSSTILCQRALFHPRGLAGHAYWMSVAPFHRIVFGSMIRNIAAAAERSATDPRADDDAPHDAGSSARS
jgi:uncharacterized protein YbjT (DUF2867 family)